MLFHPWRRCVENYKQGKGMGSEGTKVNCGRISCDIISMYTEEICVKQLDVNIDRNLECHNHLTNASQPFMPQLKKTGVTPSSLTFFHKARLLSILSIAPSSWWPFVSKSDKIRFKWLCLWIISPDLKRYSNRLRALNLTELNVHADKLCLKYLAKQTHRQWQNCKHKAAPSSPSPSTSSCLTHG